MTGSCCTSGPRSQRTRPTRSANVPRQPRIPGRHVSWSRAGVCVSPYSRLPTPAPLLLARSLSSTPLLIHSNPPRPGRWQDGGAVACGCAVFAQAHFPTVTKSPAVERTARRGRGPRAGIRMIPHPRAESCRKNMRHRSGQPVVRMAKLAKSVKAMATIERSSAMYDTDFYRLPGCKEPIAAHRSSPSGPKFASFATTAETALNQRAVLTAPPSGAA
jgi:hypothetical protein